MWLFDPTCEYRISENCPCMRLAIKVVVQPSETFTTFVLVERTRLVRTCLDLIRQASVAIGSLQESLMITAACSGISRM